MNIDKDIEILEKAIKVLTGNDTGIELDFEGTAQAIENVLSTLKREKAKVRGLSKINKEIFDELETYKKIAKHLAYAIEHNLQDDIITDILCDFTRDNKLCSEKCINCILDWARKEVENDFE